MVAREGNDFLVVLTKQHARPPWGLERHFEGVWGSCVLSIVQRENICMVLRGLKFRKHFKIEHCLLSAYMTLLLQFDLRQPFICAVLDICHCQRMFSAIAMLFDVLLMNKQ